MLKEMFVEPPELFAYNVYITAVVWLMLGVPEITPPVIDRPVGKAGEISQNATTPPVLLVTKSVIVTPLVMT